MHQDCTLVGRGKIYIFFDGDFLNWYVETKIKAIASYLELVSKELNHLAAILHVYAGGLNFMK